MEGKHPLFNNYIGLEPGPLSADDFDDFSLLGLNRSFSQSELAPAHEPPLLHLASSTDPLCANYDRLSVRHLEFIRDSNLQFVHTLQKEVQLKSELVDQLQQQYA